MKPHIILRYPFIDDSCFGAGCYATYMKYDELRRAEELANSYPGDNVSAKSLQLRVIESAENEWNRILAMKDTWLAFLIISAVALVIVVLLVIFLRNHIRIAVALIREASK